MQEQLMIIKSYLKGLEAGSAQQIVELFHPDGQVISPLYGRQPARLFYQDLFRDTQTSNTSLLDVFFSQDNRKACVHFVYKWVMANGSKVVFDCADIFEFDSDQKITLLKIIYDTADARVKWGDLG